MIFIASADSPASDNDITSTSKPSASEFETITEVYHMADPGDSDSWIGNPTVCSMGQYRVSPTQLSGKVVIMTLPLHDGYRPKLQGNGSVIKLFQYLNKF